MPSSELARPSDEASRAESLAEPTTERGRRTREALIRAARRVFERTGFLDPRIADITRAARVSYGSFYTYFPSKEAIFREVVFRLQEDTGVNVPHADRHELTPLQRIDRANRSYLESYKRNARLIAILEQVATFNDEIRAIRREVRYAYVTRSTRAIERWQREGLVPRDLDARYAASALATMVDKSFYVWLVLGEPFEEDVAIATLNRLCARALGLPVDVPSDSAPR
jgi:AcrR family transcriptional regulator